MHLHEAHPVRLDECVLPPCPLLVSTKGQDSPFWYIWLRCIHELLGEVLDAFRWMQSLGSRFMHVGQQLFGKRIWCEHLRGGHAIGQQSDSPSWWEIKWFFTVRLIFYCSNKIVQAFLTWQDAKDTYLTFTLLTIFKPTFTIRVIRNPICIGAGWGYPVINKAIGATFWIVVLVDINTNAVLCFVISINHALDGIAITYVWFTSHPSVLTRTSFASFVPSLTIEF